MKREFTISRAWFLEVAVCACGISLHGQDGRQAPASKTAAVRNIWVIGIYQGPSPFELSAPSTVKNPVLTGSDVTDMKDLNADTAAHPFMVVADFRYYMFLTAKDIKADKGGIGMAESKFAAGGDHVGYREEATVIEWPASP
jgi:hypothetical protein